jgi:hypothetical protein
MTLSAFVMTGSVSPRPGVLLSAIFTPYQRKSLSQCTLDLNGGGDGKSGQEREYGKRELHSCNGLLCVERCICKERCLLEVRAGLV